VVDVIGQDCDILMYHKNVNEGVRFGLQLYTPEIIKDRRLARTFSESISIQYLIDDETEEITKYLFFSILLADQSTDVGGGKIRDTDRGLVIECLEEGSEIIVVTSDGVYASLETKGHTMTEAKYKKFSIMSLRLVSESGVIEPADEAIFFASEWQADGESASKWSENYWR
jgi:hypothetical protein